ncbi:MAG: protein translocase subunit SecF [Ignavibacteriales bacterium]|nr:protein translocase subunit SecF [Ignavibacteriales bacterium]
MRFFRKTNIDFLGVRRRWYLVSGTVILAGMISLVVKGIDYGIDFRGGTEVLFSFSRKLDVAEIRGSLTTVGLGNSEIKSYGTEGNMLIRTTEQAEGNIVGDRIRQAIQQSFPDVRFEVLKEYRIWPKIGAELRRDALYAIIASLVAILLYIAIRFQFIYGVGAVMSLFHDVLVTLGVLSLLDGVIPVNLEITQEVIAAFLTLVGVSVNDTVVVFDRIRENLKIYRSLSLFEVMNRSLNDTLSRTIITNGSILLVVIILLLFGGESTRGFAFALMIGQISGTYSSIYIASAVVLDSSLRKKRLA